MLVKSNQITILATVPLIHSTGAQVQTYNYNANTMPINNKSKKSYKSYKIRATKQRLVHNKPTVMIRCYLEWIKSDRPTVSHLAEFCIECCLLEAAVDCQGYD